MLSLFYFPFEDDYGGDDTVSSAKSSSNRHPSHQYIRTRKSFPDTGSKFSSNRSRTELVLAQWSKLSFISFSIVHSMMRMNGLSETSRVRHVVRRESYTVQA